MKKNIEHDVSRYASINGFLAYKFKPIFNNNQEKLNAFVSPQGHTLYIQFKNPYSSLQGLQQRAIDQFNQRHCLVYVVDSVEKGIDIIDYFKYKC